MMKRKYERPSFASSYRISVWSAARLSDETGPVAATVTLLSIPHNSISTECCSHLLETRHPVAGVEDGQDWLLGAGRQDLVVVLLAVVWVFGHKIATIDTSITWGAVCSLRYLRVMFGSKGVHQLMDKVENCHLERYPTLLLWLHADKQAVEAVGLTIHAVSTIVTPWMFSTLLSPRDSPRSLLTRASHSCRLRGVASPRQTCSSIINIWRLPRAEHLTPGL